MGPPAAPKRRPDTPQRTLARALARILGSGVKPCEDQIRALKAAGWPDDRISTAIGGVALPGMSPWDWTRRVTGNGTANPKGLTASDILRLGAVEQS